MTPPSHRRTGADTHAKPQADHAERAKTLVQRIADLRAWLFLAALILGVRGLGAHRFRRHVHPQSVQPAVDRDFRGGAAVAGDRPDLRHHFRRHRPFDGLHHGAGRRGRRPCHQRQTTRRSACRSAVLLGFMVAVLVACVPGMINGLLVSRLRVPPFIGTLGMFGVARGVAFLLAGGTTVPVSNSFFAAASATAAFFGVPYIVIITAVFVLGHALPAQPDQVRPAQLRHRRQCAGGAARRHRHQVAPAAALHPVGGVRRPGRRALLRPLQRRAPRRPASRCCSTASRRW